MISDQWGIYDRDKTNSYSNVACWRYDISYNIPQLCVHLVFIIGDGH